MLDDRQIDQLEQLIVFSTMDELPLVLSRAIPVLFAELRLVKATLDSKVNSFLEGIESNDRPQLGSGDSDADYGEGLGLSGTGDTGVRGGGQPLEPEQQIRPVHEPLRSPSATEGQSAGAEATGKDGGEQALEVPEEGRGKRSVRGGNRSPKRRDQGPVVSRGGEQEMGGPLPIEERDGGRGVV